MSDDAAVNRTVVIRVLRKQGVGVAILPDGSIRLAKNGTMDTLLLPDWVEKKMLFYLNRRYKVPIHFFWNPDMMSDEIAKGAN